MFNHESHTAVSQLTTHDSRLPEGGRMSTAGRAAVAEPDQPVGEERISDEQTSRIIDEFESESPTRHLGGGLRIVIGVLAAGLAIYALYWTQFSIVTQVYRASFLL